MSFLFTQRPNSINHTDNTGTSWHLKECVHPIWGRDFISDCFPQIFSPLFWVIMLYISSQTVLWQPVSHHYIKEETQVHLFVPANSSSTVKDLLQRHSITHQYVTCLKTYSLPIICHSTCTICIKGLVYFSVLLANTNELIEMQMRNGSTDPRSGSTYYERYHSLGDVCFSSSPIRFLTWGMLNEHEDFWCCFQWWCSTVYLKILSPLQIYHWINRTAQEHPDKVKIILLGSSYEKRPLYALKVQTSIT